jgi:energy-coupling factor transporter ATP-binding protein EcfA2
VTFTPRLRGRDAQRVLIAGKAGSGKTTLAAILAKSARPCLYFDPKALNEPGFATVMTTSAFLALDPGRLSPTFQILVTPDPDGTDDAAQLDRLAKFAFTRGNMLFVVDDAMGVMTVRPPYFVNRIITMGRGRGVGFMAVSQRVHMIPRVLLTEAEHLIVFELHGQDDFDRLTSEGGAEIGEAEALPRYWFYWLDREQRVGQLFQPLEVGRGRAIAGAPRPGVQSSQPEEEMPEGETATA